MRNREKGCASVHNGQFQIQGNPLYGSADNGSIRLLVQIFCQVRNRMEGYLVIVGYWYNPFIGSIFGRQNRGTIELIALLTVG